MVQLVTLKILTQRPQLPTFIALSLYQMPLRNLIEDGQLLFFYPEPHRGNPLKHTMQFPSHTRRDGKDQDNLLPPRFSKITGQPFLHILPNREDWATQNLFIHYLFIY